MQLNFLSKTHFLFKAVSLFIKVSEMEEFLADYGLRWVGPDGAVSGPSEQVITGTTIGAK